MSSLSKVHSKVPLYPKKGLFCTLGEEIRENERLRPCRRPGCHRCRDAIRLVVVKSSIHTWLTLYGCTHIFASGTRFILDPRVTYSSSQLYYTFNAYILSSPLARVAVTYRRSLPSPLYVPYVTTTPTAPPPPVHPKPTQAATPPSTHQLI